MQHEHSCYFFIADYHALTTHPDPKELRQHARDVLVEYLAQASTPRGNFVFAERFTEIPELYML